MSILSRPQCVNVKPLPHQIDISLTEETRSVYNEPSALKQSQTTITDQPEETTAI